MEKIDVLEMGKGYMEMANINLTITNEFFHCETEGEKLGYGKMDSQERYKKAE